MVHRNCISTPPPDKHCTVKRTGHVEVPHREHHTFTSRKPLKKVAPRGNQQSNQKWLRAKVRVLGQARRPNPRAVSGAPPIHNAPGAHQLSNFRHRGCFNNGGSGLTRVMKQWILRYRMPLCHRRPVTTDECPAALQHFQTSTEGCLG